MSASARLFPDRISPARLAAVRERVLQAPAEAVAIPWAGRYTVHRAPEEPELFAELVALAGEVAGVEPRPVAFEWRRLRHGDYSLQYDDRIFAGGPDGVEVVLDLSAEGSAEAEVVWALELQPPWFVAPQQPGTVAVVAREPGILKYERHLSCRLGDREVVRLFLALRRANG
jgi:hypothetical protein